MTGNFNRRLMQMGIGAALLASPAAFAADHGDSPGVTGDGDIADFYTFMDGTDVVLILTTNAAVFSDAMQYVFHVGSTDGALIASISTTTILCEFATDQTASCWVGAVDSTAGGSGYQSFVTGDASATAGITSDDAMLKVFAGQRDDPFFFNGSGFNATLAAVVAAAPSLTFDANGCPAVDAATSGVLVGQLSTEPDGSAGLDDFAGANVAAIVISVDKTLVNGGGDILRTWTSTRTK